MKIVILPEVVDYLLELSDILYDKGYFGLRRLPLNTQMNYSKQSKPNCLISLQRLRLSGSINLEMGCIMPCSSGIKIPLGMLFLISFGIMEK